MSTWAEAPFDLLVSVFELLSYEELSAVCMVNRHWNLVASHNSLWNKLLDHYGVEKVSDNAKSDFGRWMRLFHFVKDEYKAIRDLQLRYFALLRQRDEDMEVDFTILGKKSKHMRAEELLGTTAPMYSDNSPYTKASDLPLFQEYIRPNSALAQYPKDYLCFMALITGYWDHTFPLFGQFVFYDYKVSHNVLNVVKYSTWRANAPNPDLCPGFVNKAMGNTVLNAFSPKGEILSCPAVIDTPKYTLARSFLAYFRNFVSRLESGLLEFDVEGIPSLFPVKNVPEAITDYVHIRASPLFIPWRSPTQEPMWAYQITMWVDLEAPDSMKCTLESRYWIIRNSKGQMTDQVDGEGVIGLYPRMYPGAKFSYVSCCVLEDSSGSMEGFFRFRKDSDGSTIQVQVPQFYFTIPEPIE